MENNISGKLQGISLDAFLQMAQMEQITCTLSVKSYGRKGQLFLQEGNLISAEADNLSPLQAAHRIISWENSIIEITKSCSKTVDEIKQPLMNILMEAMRLRDDAENNPAPAELPDTLSSDEPEAPEETTAAPIKESAPEKDESASEKKAPGQPESGVSTNPATAKWSPLPGLTKDLPWKYIAIGLAVVIAGVSLTFFSISRGKQTRLAFEALVQTVEVTEGTSEKLALLNTYIRENRDGKYATEANRVMQDLLAREAARGFEEIEASASRLASRGDIEGATAIYEAFLKRDEEGPYREKAIQALKNLSDQIESEAFEEMKRTAMAMGPERISTYRAFLETYPDTPHREDILRLVADMEEEYYLFLKRRGLGNEAPDDLEQTVELVRQYVDLYPESNHIEEMNRLLDRFQEEFQASRSFALLRNRANALGDDHETARNLFEDYLKAYPGSPAKEKIEQEIDRITALIEAERIAGAVSTTVRKLSEADSRFKIENNETALDTRTGLMWCLIDSQAATDRCMAYDKATDYVASLETGGFDDWRLPTAKELSRLYNKRPSFPSDSECWYWSSETEKRYEGQWLIEVKVFHPDHPDGQEILDKESWQCGAVRAVRRP